MPDKETDIQIIGGGPAGMSVAYFAKLNKINYTLYEATNEVGGNCRTLNIDKFYYDTGAHRFHDKDQYSTNLVKNLLKDELKLIDVPSQIYIDGKFINFPLSPLDLMKYMGLIQFSIETYKLLYYRIKHIYAHPDNFKHYCFFKYGRRVSNLFLIRYSEKLWGLPADKLSINIAGTRLKGLNIKSFLLEIFNSFHIKEKHLEGKFYYPKYGIGTIFTKMKNACNENIYLNSSITSIVHNNNKIIKFIINTNKDITVNKLVSSLSLDVFIRLLEPSPPVGIINIINSIKYRDLILVIFLLDKSSINDNGSMYFPSDEYIFTRIYEPKNRSIKMSPFNKTSLVVEIPCQKYDTLWQQNDDEIVEKVLRQLIEIGFFKNNEIIDIKVDKIKKAYPILSVNYESKLEPIFKYINNFSNLHINGRNGKFEYNHIHDHLKDARIIIENIKKSF